MLHMLISPLKKVHLAYVAVAVFLLTPFAAFAAIPTVTLTVTPGTVVVSPGQTSSFPQVVLTWLSTGATSCSIVRQEPDYTKNTYPVTLKRTTLSTGNKTSGSHVDTVTAFGFTNYEITCTGAGGSAKTLQTVVGSYPGYGSGSPGVGAGSCPVGSLCGAGLGPLYFPCSVSLFSNKTTGWTYLYDESATISLGESVALTWSGGIFGANSTNIINYGPVSPNSGGTVTVTPTATVVYTAQCTWGSLGFYGYSGGTSNSRSITINVSNPAIAGSCSASPASLTTGGSTTWTANASGGTGTYTYSWSGTDSLSGSARTVSKTYTTSGTKTASVTISSGGQSRAISCSNSVSVSSPPVQCSDGIDNDGDGRIDLADYGCSSGTDTTESPNPQCSDGIDNNGNGLIDTADVGACTGPTDGNEQPLPTSNLSLTGAALVRPSGTVTLSWSAANVRAGTCTLVGTNGDSWNLTGTSGTRTSSALTAEAVFTLACTDLNGQPQSTSVTVRVAPSFEEI